ncbi:MAG: SLBB domain-containing protein, partial [bacterium]
MNSKWLLIICFLICPAISQYSQSESDSLRKLYDEYRRGASGASGVQEQTTGINYMEKGQKQPGYPPESDMEDYQRFFKQKSFADSLIRERTADSLKKAELKLKDEEFDELEEIKKYRQQIFFDTVLLEPFGFDFFRNKEALSAIEEYGPVDADYVVGLGDEIVVMVWGDVEFTQSVIVNRIGTISVKGIGQVRVAGLTTKALKEKMVRRLSKVYSSIKYGNSDAKSFVDVALGRLRTKKVFLAGDVRNPGAYNVSAMSTVLNALLYAGGPLEIGSIRNIRVKRNDKIVKIIDLYDYFVKGDKSGDITLNDYDVILCPAVKKRISVRGAVHRQAIYELKENEGLKELLEFCGGIETEAYLKSINIKRTFKGDDRRIVTINNPFANVENNEKVELFDKDEVWISTIYNVLNTVTIEGSVLRPGEYEIKPEMRIKGLVELCGGVNPDCYFGRAEVFRTNDDLSSEVISVDLKKALEGDIKENVDLKKWDIVRVYSQWDLKPREYVFIRGEVRNPGRYLLRKN